MIKTRKKKTDRQKRQVILDGLFSLYIRKLGMKLAGGCQYCGTPKFSYKSLDTCHIHSRRKLTVRWDPRNAFAGCAGCHLYLDSHIDAKQEFARKLLGDEEYERLYVLAEMTAKQSKIDYKLIEIQLLELLKEV